MGKTKHAKNGRANETKRFEAELTALPAMEGEAFREFLGAGALGLGEFLADALFTSKESRNAAGWLAGDVDTILKAALALADGCEVVLREDDPGALDLPDRTRCLALLLEVEQQNLPSRESLALRSAIVTRLHSLWAMKRGNAEASA